MGMPADAEVMIELEKQHFVNSNKIGSGQDY
jgi:hypothetical protein